MRYKPLFSHYEKRTGKFFEGWYFKHVSANEAYAFIPGISIDQSGNKTAFIQIITKERSYYKEYDYSLFFASKHDLFISIGENIFCSTFLRINIPEFDLSASITYGAFRKLQENLYTPKIMGPFSYLPFMECNHSVISTAHVIRGEIKLDGRLVEISGKGYIESDWGRSFPKRYLWLQANTFVNTSAKGLDYAKNASLMVSIADIPFLGLTFRGLIGFVTFGTLQIKIGSYFFPKYKVYHYKERLYKFIIHQGKYKIIITLTPRQGQDLKAPMDGQMCHRVMESLSATMRLKVWRKGCLLFDGISSNGGFESFDRVKTLSDNTTCPKS